MPTESRLRGDALGLPSSTAAAKSSASEGVEVFVGGDGGGGVLGRRHVDEGEGGIFFGGFPGDGDFEVAVGADEEGGIVGLNGHAAGEVGEDAAGEGEGANGVFVDAGGVQLGDGGHGEGLGAGE